MKKRKLLSLMLAASLFVGALTGCAATDAETTSDTSDNAIIKLAQTGDVISFDPHNHNDTASATATRHIYSNLVKQTTDNQFVGDLAKSWEFVDDVTVKFELQPNVKFHNGETLTSEDVKFSLERQKNSSKVGHIVSMIESVEVVDDVNFILHLNTPSSTLISSLAHSGASILNKKSVEELEAAGKSIDESPIGTGPYKFESWNPGDSFSLVRFDDYFGEKAANGGLLVRVIPEESSRTIALETGEVDLVINVGATDAQRIRENQKLDLVEFESTHFEYLAFNTQKAPFDNVLVRQAFNHAVDKNSIITVAVRGEAMPNDSYLGSGAIGYSDDVTKYEYDLEKAKALLTEAGYPNGFECTVFVNSDLRSRSAQVLQASLAEIGVTLKIEQMDSGVFYDKTGSGEHQLCLTGWVANAEPDNTFRPLFHSSNMGAGGNRSFYSNTEVDQLIDESAVIQDMNTRLDNYTKVLQIVTEDAIFAPFYTVRGMVAKKANLEGLEVYSTLMHRYDKLHFVD